MPLGHNRQEWRGGGAEYLIIDKVRLVLASVPYDSHECFFHQLLWISSGAYLEGGICTLHVLIHQGHMSLMTHGQTRLWIYLVYKNNKAQTFWVVTRRYQLKKSINSLIFNFFFQNDLVYYEIKIKCYLCKLSDNFMC